MYIEALNITQFKNLTKTHIQLSKGFHFISGSNGSGKTNFLDALYIMCMTKSFLKNPDKSLVQFGADFFRLEADFNIADEHNKLELKYPLTGTKTIELNGVKYDRPTDHIGKLPVVIIAPDDVYSLRNEQEARRKFLNQTLVQSDSLYVLHLLSYNKLLKQRNAALKQMRKVSRMDHSLLDAIDYQLVKHGVPIQQMRFQLMETINPMIEHYVGQISNFRQSGSMMYDSKVTDDYLNDLKASRERDYYTMRTHLGIHKDQLNCILNQQSLNEFGSQGQIKTFVVAMKLAQFNYLRKRSQNTPLVLLDDIFAKLDSDRVIKLLEVLRSESLEQCFLTDTHTNRLSELMENFTGDSYLYKITDGQIEEL